MERRIRNLERKMPPVISDELRAEVERLAAEHGLIAEELIADIRATFRAIGYPYTIDRYMAYVARRDGLTVDEIIASLEEMK